jgi:uncharacterized protein YbbK (DUF523 family)
MQHQDEHRPYQWPQYGLQGSKVRIEHFPCVSKSCRPRSHQTGGRHSRYSNTKGSARQASTRALTGGSEDARMNFVSTEQKKPGHNLTLVSACLLGIACRFDGRSCPNEKLTTLATRGEVVPICPEVAGGLPTPRLPAEISEAYAGLDGHAVWDGRTRVLRSDGVDVTEQFKAGAQAALALARKLGIRRAILKAHSPSCGLGSVHGGQFADTLVSGDGVTAALLKRNEIQVITEEALPEGET